MQTRREILRHSLVAPLAFRLAAAPGMERVEIIAEDNCLSQESASGFRTLFNSVEMRGVTGVVVVCGANVSRDHARELWDRARVGAAIVWELSPFDVRSRALEELFGIGAESPVAIGADHGRKHGMFVRYKWPHPAMVRSFIAFTPVQGKDAETVAEYAGMPVAVQRRIGRGSITVLGSMLGPSLYARDREAQQLAAAMFAGGAVVRSSGTACAGTSRGVSANT